MDINQITDIKELKSMGFDQKEILEQTQQNLQMLKHRIGQLSQESQNQAASDESSEDESTQTNL